MTSPPDTLTLERPPSGDPAASGLAPAASALPPRRRTTASLLRFARQKPMGAVGAVTLLTLVLLATAAPLVAPYDPNETALGFSFAEPSLAFPMGLDHLGRDMLSRVIWGGRISLAVGLIATVVATALGTLLGILTAYVGGKFDLLVQRVVDGMIAFPSLILALFLMAVLGQSTVNIIIAMTFVFTPRMSRVIRSSVLTIRQQPYIEAARAIGARPWRVMAVHILPNIFGSAMVLATLTLGNAIVVEASLSFLGIGTSPDVPSWGKMLSGEAMEYLRESPHLAVFPGIAISLAVLAVNFLGDALRDIWDPRLRS